MNLANIAVFVHAQLSTSFNNTCLALSQTSSSVSHDQLNRIVKKQDFVAVYSSLIWGDIPTGGYLILDDTILQKYTRGLSIVFKLKDTKTGGFILGVNVVLLVWTDGTRTIPVAFRIYSGKGVGKIRLALELLEQAQVLGFTPEYVLFDSWYASQTVLTFVQSLGWFFVTKLKKNRRLNGKPLKHYRKTPYWSSLGVLKGGLGVVVYRRAKAFITTNDVEIDFDLVKKLYAIRNVIEEVFRVLKQLCGWQGCQLRCERGYWNHLSAGLLGFAFLQVRSKARRTSVYKVQRGHVSKRVPITQADVLEFLTPCVT
jgi:putative transposase